MKKNRVVLSLKIDEELNDQLMLYKQHSYLSKQMIGTVALKEFLTSRLEQLNNENNKNGETK